MNITKYCDNKLHIKILFLAKCVSSCAHVHLLRLHVEGMKKIFLAVLNRDLLRDY